MIRKKKEIVDRAGILLEAGFGKKDALHISSALYGKADFFLSVDKGILKKRKAVNTMHILNPIEFIRYMEENDENRYNY